MSIRDSILIEDKENCYIPNGPCLNYNPQIETKSNQCHNHINEKAEYFVKP